MWIAAEANVSHSSGVTMDLRAGELTVGMVESAIRVSLSTVDHFLPSIMSVLWNDVLPEDAIAMVDGE